MDANNYYRFHSIELYGCKVYDSRVLIAGRTRVSVFMAYFTPKQLEGGGAQQILMEYK